MHSHKQQVMELHRDYVCVCTSQGGADVERQLDAQKGCRELRIVIPVAQRLGVVVAGLHGAVRELAILPGANKRW